ncbi:MAG: insulinase family protein [Candidatus Gastranaerophilales bacterium]|nr:insulinase family protein [Candidatus Gastranaerophilales bacterium]
MKKLLIVFLCVFIGNLAFAKDFSVYKLDNGQTVIIEQIKNNPIVTIDTWIKTGSINETDKNSGISHFLEHLFFKGTQNHPTGDFDRILESKGAITNAATSKDFTHYYVTIASNYFDLAMELHADMLLNPQIPRKEMEKERKVVIEEIAKSANVPETICYENLNKLLYTTHPYLRRVLGLQSVVENVTREEVLDYYNTYYTPSNMVTLVVGDVEPEHALEIIKKTFNSSYKKPVVNDYKREKMLTEQKRNVTYTEKQTGYMMIGFRGVSITENDTYALDVLATILGSGRTSKLYRSLKEQKQLVNSVTAAEVSMRDDGIFIVRAAFIPQNCDKVEKAVFEEIAGIQERGITETELNTAKKMIESDTYYARESVSNIATEMGYVFTLTGGVKYYEEYLKNINKVSAEDVKRVANKYLVKTNSAVSVVLPKEFENIHDCAKVTAAPVQNPKVQLMTSNDITQKYRYDNGLTLLMSDTDYNDIVAISIIQKGGDFVSTKKGTSSLYGDLLLKGTKKYSPAELAQVLEEKGINISTSESADTFRINILTTKPYLDFTLEILDEILNNSIFDENELEKSKKLMLNRIKQTRDNPLKLSLDGFRSMIYSNSVYNSSTGVYENSIPSITKEDINNYSDLISNPENTVVSVTGNVENKEALISKFAAMFNSSSTEKFDYGKYSIPEIRERNTLVKTLPEQQTAWLILGWQTDGICNLKEYATLNIINTILGSGMSSRLFVNLREQEGLAYQLGSNFSPHMLSGAFIVYIGTNPATLEHSKQKALDEVYKFKTQFVSDKELKEAKERLLGQYVIALETNSDKAETLCWFEASGRGFQFVDKYKELIESVTASDIIETANKYFNDNYVMSVVTNTEK